jgi:hypothetical protein
VAQLGLMGPLIVHGVIGVSFVRLVVEPTHCM